MKNIKIDVSNKDLYNEIYIPIFHDQKRYNILYGGRDSGKSDAVASDIINKIIGPQYHKAILSRKHYCDIKDSQFATIEEKIFDYGLFDYFHIIKSPLEITCKFNNNKIIARGLDRPGKAKSIKDPTIVWYEEANEMKKVDFLTTSLSLRTSKDSLLKEYLTFNSEDEACWINGMFFPPKQSYEKPDGNFNYIDSIRDDTTILHTTYNDNRFATSRSKHFESLKVDKEYYDIFVLGLWGAGLKGVIYPNWELYKDETPKKGYKMYGLDFGYNNESALIEITLDFENKKLYEKEIFYESGLTPSDIIKRLVDVIPDRSLPIFADSAEKGLIEDIKRARFNIYSAHKDVLLGITYVKSYQEYIYEYSKNLKREQTYYKWLVDKNGNAMDKPFKFDDHLMDAKRYAVYSFYKEFLQSKTAAQPIFGNMENKINTVITRNKNHSLKGFV